MATSISIHPPREGWDFWLLLRLIVELISIHPPREGWDLYAYKIHAYIHIFQSTHPVRGGTHLPANQDLPACISIHPPREGWDMATAGSTAIRVLISIHPPREGWDRLLGAKWQP